MIFYVRRPHIGAFHISKRAMYIVRVDLGCVFESRLTHASLPSPASSLGSPSPHKHTHTLTATPRHVNYEEVKRDLGKVAGVKHAHSLHIWSLTLTRTALAAHLALGEYCGLGVCGCGWMWVCVGVGGCGGLCMWVCTIQGYWDECGGLHKDAARSSMDDNCSVLIFYVKNSGHCTIIFVYVFVYQN